ncbi:hypothetical protein Vretimale_16155 [Volvox reticuliferus]|uniref:Uncharacterized protein n=1 Tax=Volvox reticuliferus TaxID=1737510 RepID=A0A8J4GQL8_9CHLO|nr:hypothetical protein Vretimale_16155 [Volvox reticuliferus]
MAVSEALSISPSTFGAGLAADDLILTLYFVSIYYLARNIPPDGAPGGSSGPQQQQQHTASGGGGGEGGGGGHGSGGKVITVPEALAALSISASVCYIAVSAAKVWGMPGQAITIITALSVALATAVPRLLAPLVPSAEGLAQLLMQVWLDKGGLQRAAMKRDYANDVYGNDNGQRETITIASERPALYLYGCQRTEPRRAFRRFASFPRCFSREAWRGAGLPFLSPPPPLPPLSYMSFILGLSTPLRPRSTSDFLLQRNHTWCPFMFTSALSKTANCQLLNPLHIRSPDLLRHHRSLCERVSGHSDRPSVVLVLTAGPGRAS